MVKAKRKDPVAVDRPSVSSRNKRQKAVHVEKQKEQRQQVKKEDGAIVSARKQDTSTSASPAPEALRIVIGSYEKVLCGIDAKLEHKTNKVQRLHGRAYMQNNLVLNPVYMFSAHAGAIKCLAINDRYLVSGGSDEVIKYQSHTAFLTKEYTT